MADIEHLETENMEACQQKSASLESDSDHIEDARHGEQKGDVHVVEPEDINNPQNWPQWKKDINLALISFHAMMTNFVGAGIIPVYSVFAEMFGKSVQDISYFTSIHILCTGLVPFILVPISNRYGRRPVWLVSTLFTAAFNIGCAKSSSYGTMMACRILGSLFLSSPIALGPPVVVEMYRENERGVKMGIWTALVTLGPPLGPFIMGFVAQRAGWQWIYWTFVIVSAVQFVLYAIFSQETKRVDPAPFTLEEFRRPFTMLKYMTVLIPIYSHSMIFNLSAAMLTVEIPQLFAERFHFNAQQIGLQFIGIIVGTIVGETANVVVLKYLRRRASKQHLPAANPTSYLVASYLGFLCMIAGRSSDPCGTRFLGLRSAWLHQTNVVLHRPVLVSPDV
ncbi:hypothetical protein FE257_000212 [Aspergillus nanangensis]|uniref:Major facilitator superfamily (MFS) profile domain-containing protein n=1 Tax=Aspergillus nanangensis TaxID=2582783 RepID=A0AAD4D0Q4_ASPNN|nr:hypothetical protein FE257_000212 [Aspergillus nanangensis]